MSYWQVIPLPPSLTRGQPHKGDLYRAVPPQGNGSVLQGYGLLPCQGTASQDRRGEHFWVERAGGRLGGEGTGGRLRQRVQARAVPKQGRCRGLCPNKCGAQARAESIVMWEEL